MVEAETHTSAVGRTGLPAALPRQGVLSTPEYATTNTEKPPLRLPHFCPQNLRSYPLMHSSTLRDVLRGHYDRVFDARMIVDCRFQYEYQGGHVETATNCEDWTELSDLLSRQLKSENTLIVLYCEFSSYRVTLL